MKTRHGLAMACAALGIAASLRAAGNLLSDPSFEEPKDRDQFGLVFARWGGWKYEGDCSFEVGRIARTGGTSALLRGTNSPKIRITVPERELAPGRYRTTAYLRGLDIGTGTWNSTTEFMFAGKYFQLQKRGTFGWTRLTYVADVAETRKVLGPSFGLMAPGFLWVDDVSLELVSPGTALTPAPVLGSEESAIVPPGDLGPGAVRCTACGYRVMPVWGDCYACGEPIAAAAPAATGPAVKLITSFEDQNPCTGPGIAWSNQHASHGGKSLRIDRQWASLDRAQDWSGYDYLMIDVFADADEPVPVYVEVRDTATRDYWSRVNYVTVVPPGASTLAVPIRQLYVGEKSRPGRRLLVNDVTRLAIAHSAEKPPGPIFIDNLRLERDDAAQEARFAELYAFDFGTASSPVMEGFMAVTPGTLYSQGRGYGLKDARVWRAFDVLQPEPLYQDFICIEAGGLAVDLPNGTYRVFVNLDNPSGFWGEFQTYTSRSVIAEGKEVVRDTLDFARQMQRYFRHWSAEDLPAEDTFDKYQKTYYSEKRFDVEVNDGQLNLEFRGANWACSVSAVVLYPATQAAQGEAFMHFVEARRRFHFSNYFKRVLHRPSGEPLAPTTADQAKGYVLSAREPMREVFYNDTPAAGEVCSRLAAEAFAGEYEPVALTVLPLRDLGAVTVTVSDLVGPGETTVPATAIDIGYVSYRVSRVTMEGTVYTIAPRLIMPAPTVDCASGVARRFWLTVRPPAETPSGRYRGTVGVNAARGGATEVPLELRVRRGGLDPVDIPVGPWGYTITVPWRDAQAQEWQDRITARCLSRLHDYGFTSFSGVPEVRYLGFEDGKPRFDFSRGDARMQQARKAGFSMPVVNYGPFAGLNLYYRDENAMKAAGFTDYSAFVKTVFGAVQEHAEAAGWLPVYWNLGDEPIGDDLRRSAENAEAYRQAVPQGPPFFTAASSYAGNDPADPHFRLAKALHVANWNTHSEASVGLLRQAGSGWAFYNGGNRWTFGTYMYKAAKQFGMQFRLSWHWNCNAGDPYYALDCREDDYAWCNATPEGELIPSVHFEHLREGLDDYRYLLTADRLSRERAGTPAAAAARKLIDDRLAAFTLGQRNHDALFDAGDWQAFRRQLGDAIEALRAAAPGGGQ